MTLTLFLGLAILFMAPGPTNALLLAAGADGGLRHAFRFVSAVALGYLASVLLLGVLAAPLLQGRPLLVDALRLGAAAYLAGVAFRMWNRHAPTAGSGAGDGVSVAAVALATLLNPKGLIIALTLLPPETFGATLPASAALAAIATLSAGAALLWMALGAFWGRGLQAVGGDRLAKRGSAAVIGAFAAILAGAALAG